MKTEQSNRAAVRELFLLAILWMPLGFFLWFKFGPAFVHLCAITSSWVLTLILPEAISGVSLVQHTFDINTLIPAEQLVEGRVAMRVISINPMIYGYGVPVLLGLVMATPGLQVLERIAQLLGGYLLLVLVQTWGVVWETLKILSLDMGMAGARVMAELGLSINLVALCYQLGYLLLAPLSALAIWVTFNHRFVNHITAGRFMRQRRT